MQCNVRLRTIQRHPQDHKSLTAPRTLSRPIHRHHKCRCCQPQTCAHVAALLHAWDTATNKAPPPPPPPPPPPHTNPYVLEQNPHHHELHAASFATDAACDRLNCLRGDGHMALRDNDTAIPTGRSGSSKQGTVNFAMLPRLTTPQDAMRANEQGGCMQKVLAE